MKNTNIGPGMAKQKFMEAIVTEITMKTYDPAMRPEKLIENTIAAYRKVERLTKLMKLDTPDNADVFDCIAGSTVNVMKDIVNIMEEK